MAEVWGLIITPQKPYETFKVSEESTRLYYKQAKQFFQSHITNMWSGYIRSKIDIFCKYDHGRVVIIYPAFIIRNFRIFCVIFLKKMVIWVAVLPRVDQLTKVMPSFWKAVYIPYTSSVIGRIYNGSVIKYWQSCTPSRFIGECVVPGLNATFCFFGLPIVSCSLLKI